MGESERYLEYKQYGNNKPTLGNPKNAIIGLLAVQAAFFLTLYMIRVFFYTQDSTYAEFEHDVMRHFQLKSDWSLVIRNPWTLLTYMFSESGDQIWRLVSNLLWLSAFGYLWQEQQENDKIVPVFLYGGFFAGLCFMLISPDKQSVFLGANGAVMAVAAATVTYNPMHRFFRHIGHGVPVWVLLVLYVFIDFSSVVSAHFVYPLSHIVGGLTGFVFAWFLRKGVDAGLWMHQLYHGMMNLFTPSDKNQTSAQRHRKYYETAGRAPFTKQLKLSEHKLNEILEKIHNNGYDSLTDSEKKFLQRASETDDSEEDA